MRKQMHYQIAFIVAATLITVIATLANLSSKPQNALLNGEYLYQRATQAIANSHKYSYSVQTDKKITTNQNTYTESLKQTITYIDSGNESFQLASSDIISVGDYAINSTYQYENGTAYLNLDGSSFSSKLSRSQVQQQYPPAILLNPNYYNTIRSYTVKSGTVVCFYDAKAAEIWAENSNITFQQAGGIALIDQDGALTETIYCIRYTNSDTTIEKSVIVKPTKNDVAFTQIDKTAYTPISNLNAPLALELACGYLLQSDKLSSNTTDNIACDAFGDRYIQNIALSYSNTPEDFSASLSTSLLQQNSSRGGEITESTQALTFSDGACSVSTNNIPSAADESITQEVMMQYCQDVLIGSILLPQDITAVKFTETETQYRYDYTATRTLANSISEKACLALYNDGNFLQNLATAYTSSGVTAYISLDKATLIPTASGISYKGTYQIDNFPYELSYTVEQQYD